MQMVIFAEFDMTHISEPKNASPPVQHNVVNLKTVGKIRTLLLTTAVIATMILIYLFTISLLISIFG